LGELVVRVTKYGLRGGMMPSLQDFKDARQQVMYYFGAAKEQPRFDRFGFREKFEYFGVIWGSVIMVITGALLMRPEFFTQFMPGWLISSSRAAHGGEALLAILTIVIWHMYNAIFRPDIFPLDKAMFTGHISEERYKHEHPLEYEREVGKPVHEVEVPNVEENPA
jgi:cytochrome b subunit of formate dehydrogenase